MDSGKKDELVLVDEEIEIEPANIEFDGDITYKPQNVDKEAKYEKRKDKEVAQVLKPIPWPPPPFL